MKFLADEGVDKGIVQQLREHGYSVTYIIEQTRGMSDNDILEIAEREDRILITKDKDFGELIFRLNKIHAGVILLRLEGMSTSERSQLVCSQIMKYHNRLKGSFTVIQKELIRIRGKDN